VSVVLCAVTCAAVNASDTSEVYGELKHNSTCVIVGYS